MHHEVEEDDSGAAELRRMLPAQQVLGGGWQRVGVEEEDGGVGKSRGEGYVGEEASRGGVRRPVAMATPPPPVFPRPQQGDAKLERSGDGWAT